MMRGRALLCAVMLSLMTSGCASMLPALVQIGSASRMVTSYLGLIDEAAMIWAAAHPDDEQLAKQLIEAIGRVKHALIALDRLGASAEAYTSGDVAAAKLALIQAYTELYQLAQEMGIVPGGAPRMTSYSDRMAEPEKPAQPPPQVEAMTPAELEEMLR